MTALLAVVIVLIITVGCTCALAWWLGYDQGYRAAMAYRKADVADRKADVVHWTATRKVALPALLVVDNGNASKP